MNAEKNIGTQRLLIVDDHAVIRTGIKFLLAKHFEHVVVEEADSCTGLKKALTHAAYTHAVVDLQLGDCNCMDVLPDVLASHPGLGVLVYTMSPEAAYAKRLLQKGVLGFLSKNADEATVVHALALLLNDQPYISDALKKSLTADGAKNTPSDNPFDDLSEREWMVLQHLLRGERVKEIANCLALKITTVATYKVRIFEKLGIDNLVDLQRLANRFHVH